MSFRIKDQPKSEFSLDADYLAAFERSLQLRHELIHNPNSSRRKLKKDEWNDLHSIAGLIFGCDVVLNNFISEHLDDEVKRAAQKGLIRGVKLSVHVNRLGATLRSSDVVFGRRHCLDRG